MHICPSCGAQYACWLSRCGRCHHSPLLDQEAIMAKITRHGGPSDANDPNRTDTLLGPTDGGNPAPRPAGVSEAEVAAEVPADAPQDDSGAQGPESEDGGAAPTVELPGVSALKATWEEALLTLGVSPSWVYGENRTKDQLIAAGQGLADGSQVLDGEALPVPAEGSTEPTSDEG